MISRGFFDYHINTIIVNYNATSSVGKSSSTAAVKFLHPEALSVFSGTDSTSQVAMTFELWDDGSDTGSATDAVNAVNDYVSTMQDSSYDQDTSFLYHSGSIVGYLWSGTEVQNLGTVDILNQFVSEINSNGIMDTKYIQYTVQLEIQLLVLVLLSTLKEI
jgi:hypothetical protein